jgi:TonB family protein
MDSQGYNNDDKWVEERIAKLSPPPGWRPDAEKAFEDVLQRSKPAAMRPIVRLWMAAATIAVIGVVVVLLPWKTLWTPKDEPTNAAQQTAPPAQTSSDILETGKASAPAPQTQAAIATIPAPEIQASPSTPSQPVAAQEAKGADPSLDAYLQGKAEYQRAIIARSENHPDVVRARAQMERAKAMLSPAALQAVENPTRETKAAPPQQAPDITLRSQGPLRPKKEPRPIIAAVEPQKDAVPAVAQAQEQQPPSGVTQPVVISQVRPAYTPEAREARIQGTIEVVATVREDGTAKVESIVRGLGYGLDEAAAAAVEQWKFIPGKKDGKPVAVTTNILINFSLR